MYVDVIAVLLFLGGFRFSYRCTRQDANEWCGSEVYACVYVHICTLACTHACACMFLALRPCEENIIIIIVRLHCVLFALEPRGEGEYKAGAGLREQEER